MMLVMLPVAFDPYGKDASKATTGTDNLYRVKVDTEGYICGTVACLSQEEATAYRKDNAIPSHRRRA